METTLRGLNLGYFGLDMSALLDAPPYYGVPYQCPAIAYIIEHPEGRVLFETGLSEHAIDEWLPEWKAGVDLTTVLPEHYLANRLKQIGLGPEDFRYVVLGHLHTDHSGGTRVFERANVEVVVHEDEYRHVRDLPVDAVELLQQGRHRGARARVAHDGDRRRATSCCRGFAWCTCRDTRPV